MDILIIVMFIDLIIISYGTTIKFLSSIDQKKDYEFITVNQKDYVILSEYDGKYLVTPYVNDNGAYTFYTNKYEFVEMNQGIICYKRISYPTIDKETNN